MSGGSIELATSVLRRRFGLSELRPVQGAVIERLLSGAGSHAMVVLPTGSGKSLCYQLPALGLQRRADDAGRAPGVALVFSPLIALMEDQVASLKKRGVRAAYINSTLSKPQRQAMQAALARGEYEIVYATPERMTKPEFVEAMSLVPGGVTLLAVDEMHCVSKWGHDLRPAYRRIGEFTAKLKALSGAGFPVVALTATATRAVREDVRAVLGLDEVEMPLFSTGVARPNLELRAAELWTDEDKLTEIRTLSRRFPGTGIVYFALIKDLERLSGEVARATGCPVEVYHGRLDPREKKRVYRRFTEAKPDEGLILCATNAFGMGVDKPDIRFIAHAQVPGSVEAYYQEVGRAGRDGEPSGCRLLYMQDDLAIQQQFCVWQNPSADLVRRAADAIETRYGGAGAGQGHTDFVSDELYLDVIGKGRGDQRLQYVLAGLADLGVIEPTGFFEGGEPRYRFVRPLDDSEVDPAEIEEKRKRDLTRLLDVVKMVRCDDIALYIDAYFEL